jgi:hypothetical protein
MFFEILKLESGWFVGKLSLLPLKKIVDVDICASSTPAGNYNNNPFNLMDHLLKSVEESNSASILLRASNELNVDYIKEFLKTLIKLTSSKKPVISRMLMDDEGPQLIIALEKYKGENQEEYGLSIYKGTDFPDDFSKENTDLDSLDYYMKMERREISDGEFNSFIYSIITAFKVYNTDEGRLYYTSNWTTNLSQTQFPFPEEELLALEKYLNNGIYKWEHYSPRPTRCAPPY